MIRKSAVWLSNTFLDQGWIERDNLDWCIYALEKRLGFLFYIAVVSVWLGFSGLYIETLAFIIPLYSLRQRMGGIHAKSACVCFLISICLVIFPSAFLGDILLRLPLSVLFVSNLICITFAVFLKPAYPLQVHFSLKEINANIHRKNIFLFLLFVAQCISLLFHDGRVLVHSFSAVVICVLTVLMQKLKGRLKDEQT